MVLEHDHVDHFANLVTNLVETTGSLETVVAKVVRRPFYVLALLVVHPHRDSFDDLHLASLQILKVVDVFVAAFLVVAVVDDIHDLVKQTLANALTDVAWVDVQGKLGAEPMHRSCAVRLEMRPSNDGLLIHVSCSRLLTLTALLIASRNRDKARQAGADNVANPVSNLRRSLLFSLLCTYRVLDIVVVNSLRNVQLELYLT